MADHERQTRPAADAHPPAGAAANDQVDNRPATGEPQLLPPWKVLLHNDNVNSQPDVVETKGQLDGGDVGLEEAPLRPSLPDEGDIRRAPGRISVREENQGAPTEVPFGNESLIG